MQISDELNSKAKLISLLGFAKLLQIAQITPEIDRQEFVPFKHLNHGEWKKWCADSLDITPQHGNRYIRVYERFANRNPGFSLGRVSLAAMNALYLIATMPEESRTESHTIPSTGAEKTVDEMTLREYSIK